MSGPKTPAVRQWGTDELTVAEALSIYERNARHSDTQGLGELPTLTPTQAAAWLKDSKGDFGDAVLDPWA